MIRPATIDDAKNICEIYNHYIKNSVITFEKEEVSVSEMEDRIQRVSEKYPWLVFASTGLIQGYAYANQWKVRSAYDRTVESTIYIGKDHFGKGLGKALYSQLMTLLKEQGFHSVLGGIALPNDASVDLHESLGFVKVGQLKEVGFKLGRWVDVGYWELIL